MTLCIAMMIYTVFQMRVMKASENDLA
jgi:hypothetical protein